MQGTSAESVFPLNRSVFLAVIAFAVAFAARLYPRHAPKATIKTYMYDEPEAPR